MDSGNYPLDSTDQRKDVYQNKFSCILLKRNPVQLNRYIHTDIKITLVLNHAMHEVLTKITIF